MSSLSVSRVASLTEVGEPEWDHLVPATGFYSSWAWLLTQEAVPVTYLLVRSGGRLVGGLPLYRFRNSRRELYAELFGRDADLLHAGVRTGYRSHFLTDTGLCPDEGQRVRSALVSAAAELGHEYGYDGVVFDFLSNEGLRQLHEGADPVIAYRMADAEIYTGGADREKYLCSLPSKARRNARLEIRRFESAGWAVGRERMSSCLPEAATLLSSTQHKYGSDMDVGFIYDFLSLTAKHVDDRSVVFTCRESSDGRDSSGDLVGYAMMFRWADSLYGRVVGFDYPRLRDSFEYFNLTIYQSVQYLHEHGLARLHVGPGAAEAKIRRGAVATPLWSGAIFGAGGTGGADWRHTSECEAFADQMRAVAPSAVRAEDWDLTELSRNVKA